MSVHAEPSPEEFLEHRPVRVFFPCTGLGRQRRGFETFTIECANALRDDPRLEISVFSGGSTRDVEATTLWNLPRDSWLAAWLGRLHGRGAYFTEQVTFFLSFLPHLIFGGPDVVYFADLNLGNLCWHWRRLSRQKYRLLFYNGGLTTKPFTRADAVQQVTPMGLSEALARGEDRSQQIVLPHGLGIATELPSRLPPGQRAALGLPADRRILLSVGMVDTTIKRMDYLVREVAALADRPFLAMIGAETDETAAVRSLASNLLGDGNFLIRSVDRSLVSHYYRAADVFVLCSLREGFGLAYVEALAHGLPVIAHDFQVTRYLLGQFAWLRDLSVAGNLSPLLAKLLGAPVLESERAARHDSAFVRFGWIVLREDYSAMLRQVAALGKRMR